MSLRQTYHLSEDEEIIALFRQHWLVLARRLAPAAVLILAAFFFLSPLAKLGTIGMVIFALMAAAGGILIFQRFFRWHRTLLLITDKRIIDVDRRGLFDRVVSEVSLNKVHDVSYRHKGIWETFFRYGSVMVQATASNVTFVFKSLPNPVAVRDLVISLEREATVAPSASAMPQETSRKFFKKVALLNRARAGKVLRLAEEETRDQAIDEVYGEDILNNNRGDDNLK